MKKFYFFYYILLAVTAHACNDDSAEPTGGPCSYTTKIYTATVIDIEKKDSTHADIFFRINDEAGNLYRDSVSWFIENNNWLEISQVEKDSILTGKKYKYQVDKIKTGSCDPDIEKLTLEKF